MLERIGPKPEVLGNFKLNLARGVWNSLRKNLELEFSQESQNNLTELNEQLLTNSTVVYINHSSKLDAPIAISMVLSQLTNAKNILGPVGMKHYDWTRDPLSAALFRILPLFHVQPAPVVQVEDEKNYGVRRQRMIENLKKQTSIKMKQAGSVYGIAPEGTRNTEKGILIRANRGMGYLEQYQGLFYLPVAIIYKKYSSKPEVAVGKPLQLQDIIPDILDLSFDPEIRAQEITNRLMFKLAEIMPEELRGFYK